MQSSSSHANSISSELNLAVLRVLVIEDDEVDFKVVSNLLKRARVGKFAIEWAGSFDRGLSALSNDEYDVCLLDHRLGVHNGLDLLKIATGSGTNLPFVLLTGMESDSLELLALAKGAADFLNKDQLTTPLLERCLRYAVHQHRLHAQLQTLAEHDELTGLFNRRTITSKLEEALARMRRTKSTLGAFFLDLDRFKPVNDILGHKFGDIVLQQVASRLQDALRETDFVGRLGGDEFLVIVENLDNESDAALVAYKLIEELSAPYNIDDKQARLGVSIGIATSNGDGDSSDAVIRRADLAMYVAKPHGNEYFIYREDLKAPTYS